MSDSAATPRRPDLPKALRDGAYAAVGLGVLGFQRAQVNRRELLEQLESYRRQVAEELGELSAQVPDARRQLQELVGQQLGAARQQVHQLLEQMDIQVEPVRRRLDQSVDDLEQRLPEQARGAISQLRSLVQAQEAALRRAAGLN